MPAKPAARLGDTTAHGGTVLPGPGAIAPKAILINGKPGLRAPTDTCVCPIPIAPPAPAPHGPEKCVLGSMTVLFNGQMAVRVGDMWIGAAPPNSVTVGSTHVFIGDIGFGLADPANMTEFCKGFAKLVTKWPGLTPAQRRQEMADLLNQQLGKGGTPAIGVKSNSALAGTPTLGQFDFPTGNIDVNPDLLAKNSLPSADAKKLANTLYHEARHSEQWSNMARVQAGNGTSAAKISSNMGIPLSAAQAAVAAPLSGSAPEAVMGGAMHQSVYGTNAAHRGSVLRGLKAGTPGTAAYTKLYEKYRALPEEQDAWSTGNTLPCGH